ncbi:cupin domain-containing protein [Deinococcus altitudinis]|uniref:cupin domain-containing protein n=1 Tax=Deinococcus altitudinis TaxID=468914 RepID=UPI003892C5D1
MNQLEEFGQELVGRPFSRRDAVRLALFGAVNLGVLSPGALAQGTPAPAVPAPAAPPPLPRVPADFMLNLAGLPSSVVPTNVVARKGNQKAWPVLQGVSIAHVEIPSGGERAPHLHTNTAELAVILKGAARAGIQNEAKEWTEVDLQEGQCVYFPLGWPHWLRNTGDGPLTAYFNYGHETPATVELP